MGNNVCGLGIGISCEKVEWNPVLLIGNTGLNKDCSLSTGL